MKSKTIFKIIIDSLLTILLMASMGRQFWGDAAHEWFGIGMFVLFIAHHLLNLNWYKNLFKGKYPPYRIMQLTVDILVFAAMLGLMISGISLAQHVPISLPSDSNISFVRILHMLSVYWGFVLMSFHFGLHWNLFISMAAKAFKLPNKPVFPEKLLQITGILIALYGLYAFIIRGYLTYMFGQTVFVFLDYEEPVFLYYLDTIAMMGFFIWIAHFIETQFRKHKVRKQ